MERENTLSLSNKPVFDKGNPRTVLIYLLIMQQGFLSTYTYKSTDLVKIKFNLVDSIN